MIRKLDCKWQLGLLNAHVVIKQQFNISRHQRDICCMEVEPRFIMLMLFKRAHSFLATVSLEALSFLFKASFRDLILFQKLA